ncbi:MAG TPA: energy transducer TonB, partial [Rubricoccaceae bacterium]
MRGLAALLLVLAAPAFGQAPDSTLHFSEVQPTLIGGIEALQRSIVYPAADRRAGVQGRVIVQFVVDEHGVPVMIRVARGVSAGLDSAAVAAVRAARFTPGSQDGRPVKVRFSLPVTFRLLGEPAPYVTQGHFNTNSVWRAEFAARADSGAVVGGRGRLVWLAVSPEIARAEAVVDRGQVVEVITTLAPGVSPAAWSPVPSDIAEVNPRPDGYRHAVDLVERGLRYDTDVAVDEAGRTIRTRAPRCETSSPASGCVSVFPMLLGGADGVVARARFPASVPQPFPEGRVVFSADVDGRGFVSDVRLVSNTIGGPAGRGMADALGAALADAQF